MKFNYRIAVDEDFSQLVQVGLESYKEFKDVLLDAEWKKLSSGLNNRNKIQEVYQMSKVFVCEYQDDIVGVAYLVPPGNPTENFHADWSYIRMVGVKPQFRGCGIGKELTKQCLLDAKTKGFKTIALHTSEMMPTAMRIYESIGFERQREFQLFGKRYWVFTKNIK